MLYNVASVTPEIAVGNANGISTSASRNARPTNFRRTSTHAKNVPNTTSKHAAASDAPNVNRNEASVRGAQITVQKRDGVIPWRVSTTEASGTRIAAPKIAMVMPNDTPLP